MDLGRRIAAWRERKQLSRKACAKRVGVSVSAVYQWEGSGKSQTVPSQPHLAALVKALGLTMPEFYGPLPKAEK